MEKILISLPKELKAKFMKIAKDQWLSFSAYIRNLLINK